MTTLLIVTSEPKVGRSIKTELEKVGYTITVAGNLKAAKDYSQEFSCVICEHILSDGSGLDLVDHYKNIPLIFLLEPKSQQAGLVAMRRGAFDCLAKPLEKKDLIRAVDRAVAVLSHSGREDGMIGQCDQILKLKKQISRVAPLGTTILIGGESGTGKELVAKAIHLQSLRSKRDNISVNCAAIPESLVEAELFGHVKGAFTGATQDRQGLIESADQSTLFLDGIGELPIAAQSRLLRVLQEGEIRRVGSTDGRYVDIRLIAATHRNLLDMVARGQFREDLYYRLNVIELRCPALRERDDDIMILAQSFLNDAKIRMDRSTLKFSKSAKVALMSHAWPGNIRELQNGIERAVVLCEGPCIEAVDLGLNNFSSDKLSFSASEQRLQIEPRPVLSLEDYFQHFVLSHEDHMSETELAKRLGISRKSLWERRNRLGIPRRKDDTNDEEH